MKCVGPIKLVRKKLSRMRSLIWLTSSTNMSSCGEIHIISFIKSDISKNNKLFC
jgi:hypothetical protein